MIATIPAAVLAFSSALAGDAEVRIPAAPGGPEFAGALTLPSGPGPHPAALLVSPAGEHPRDEIESGSRHFADLAARLAESGIASLRVDNRGVGGSRNAAWPAWSFDLGLEARADDVARHVAWLRSRPEIDRNRVGLVAHGDAAVAAAIAASRDAGNAFVVLLSPYGVRLRDALAKRQSGGNADVERSLGAALDAIAASGATEESIALAARAFAEAGLPPEAARAAGEDFAREFSSTWHRALLAHDPVRPIAAIESPLLVLFGSKDERLDAALHGGAVRAAVKRASLYNARVETRAGLSHFLSAADDASRFDPSVPRAIAEFACGATGFLPGFVPPPGKGPAPGDLRIANANVVDVRTGTVLENRTIDVEKGRIAAIHEGAPPEARAGVATLDAAGAHVVPGLVDAHVHLSYWGADALALCVEKGVLTVRDMGGDLAQLSSWRDRVARGEILGPRIVMAGPFVDGEKKNFQFRRFARDADEARAAVKDLLAAHVDFIKVHSRLPREAFFALANECRARGVPFSGHVPAGISPVDASDAGMACIEHADSLLSALARADDSPAPSFSQANAWWQGPDGAAAIARIEKNGTRFVPTLVGLETALPRLNDGMAPVYGWLRDLAARLHRSGIVLLAGSDFARRISGIVPGDSLLREIELLADCGLGPAEALRAATLRSAETLGLEGEIGAVEAGLAAELVLVDGNPLEDLRRLRAVRAVVTRGHAITR